MHFMTEILYLIKNKLYALHPCDLSLSLNWIVYSQYGTKILQLTVI